MSVARVYRSQSAMRDLSQIGSQRDLFMPQRLRVSHVIGPTIDAMLFQLLLHMTSSTLDGTERETAQSKGAWTDATRCLLPRAALAKRGGRVRAFCLARAPRVLASSLPSRPRPPTRLCQVPCLLWHAGAPKARPCHCSPGAAAPRLRLSLAPPLPCSRDARPRFIAPPPPPPTHQALPSALPSVARPCSPAPCCPPQFMSQNTAVLHSNPQSGAHGVQPVACHVCVLCALCSPNRQPTPSSSASQPCLQTTPPPPNLKTPPPPPRARSPWPGNAAEAQGKQSVV